VRRRALPVALAVAAGAALAAAPAGSGATRTLTLEGWHDRALAFSGRTLVWTEAATVRVDPRRIRGAPPGAQRFDYYRADVSRARLDRASRRFAGPAETPVSVRTSIARMGSGTLAPTGDGGFVAVPSSSRLPPPTIWCCDDEGIEAVIDSDGRPGAPRTVAATWTGSAVRFVQLDAAGRQVVRLGDPGGGAVPPPAAAEPGAPDLVAVAGGGLRAWADPAQPARLLVARDGSGSPPAAIALPGPALRVWAAPGLVAVLSRAGARLAVTRIDAGAGPPSARRVWSGAALPAVAVGAGTLAIADGRRVLASRLGRAGARRVTTARRRVDAIGADGARLAWVERGRRKGLRVGILRLARLG
jgi:hypothetical protein